MLDFDLHIHTNVSPDAVHTPLEVYDMVNEQGIKYFAVTDHNDLDGSFELASCFKGNGGAKLIPAVEISTWLKGVEVHLLAYGVSYYSEALIECFKIQDKNRDRQTLLRCEALKQLGFSIDFDELKVLAGDKCATTVSIFELLQRDRANDKLLYEYIYGNRSDSPYMNFYKDFTSYGGKAYVGFSLLDFEYAVDILKNEALLAIAHPMVYSEDFLPSLLVDGISGLEIYSTYKMDMPLQFYKEFIKKYNLIATGGSDFHGESMKPNIKLGGFTREEGVFEQFLELLNLKSNEPLVELA